MTNVYYQPPTLKPEVSWLKKLDIPVWIFVIFCLMVFVKLNPEPASSIYAINEAFVSRNEGDAVRQLVFIVLLGFAVFFHFSKNGLKVPRSLSALQLVALAYLLISFTWSSQPDVAFRRAVFMVMVAVSVAYQIDSLGVERTLKALYITFAVVLVLSIIALPFPFGRHPAEEVDQELVGNWKGIFYHKNIAGAFMAAGVIFFFHYFLYNRKVTHLILMGGCAVFLYGTQSVTPMLLITPSVVISLIFRTLSKSNGRKRLFAFLVVLGFLALASVVLVFFDKLEALWFNPESFSGRTAIWRTALGYLANHWLLGAGFNSFWGVESNDYIISDFVALIGHSHSGYLEVFVTTGIFGLILTLLASVILTFSQLLKIDSLNYQIAAVLFNLWFFFILENFFESQFYNIDKEAWVILMISVFLTQKLYVSTRPPRAFA